MRINQVMVGARDGDAITQIGFNMRSVLSEFGASDIFGLHIDPSVHGRVRPLAELASNSNDTTITILHMSIGDETVAEAIRHLRGRLWIFYHNISPASMFRDSPDFAAMLELGRSQFRSLAPGAERVLVSSVFNGVDARSMGAADVFRVGPMIDPYRLRSIHSNPEFGRSLAHRLDGPMTLFVGQMLPHKRPELLIAAHHLVVTRHNPSATLALVGHHPSIPYARRLAAYVERLGLSDRVWITGGLDDSQLGEMYRRADVLATASAHEGVCVPVIEAMAMSVPVVASEHGALPETVGAAGVMVRGEHPSSYAEAISYACDPAHRAELSLVGRQRAEELSLETSATHLREYLSEWVRPLP